MTVFLAILVFISAAGIDWCAARYTMAVGRSDAHRAALWSCGQWLAGTVGFLIVVKVSMWLLPVEGLGLYIGTRLAMRQTPSKVKQ